MLKNLSRFQRLLPINGGFRSLTPKSSSLMTSNFKLTLSQPQLNPSIRFFCESPFKKLFVGNLPFSATEEELSSFLSTFGRVVSTRIIIDRYTQRPRGFGFVEMDAEAAGAVLSNQNLEFQGRMLKIAEAMNKPLESRPYEQRQRYEGRNSYGDRPPRDFYSRGEPSRDRNNRRRNQGFDEDEE